MALAPPQVASSSPQPTTGTAKFPAAKPGFRPGGLGGTLAAGAIGGATGGIKQAPTPGAPAPAAVGGLGPAPASPSGFALDSTALGQIAQHQFSTNQSVTGLNQQGAYARTDLQKALAGLAQKQPLETQKTVEGYNHQGLLYSGHLGQSLGQLGQSFADRQASLNSNFTRGEAGRQSRISGLGEAEKLFEQQAASGSTGRQTAQAAADQTIGLQAQLAQAIAAAQAAQAAQAPQAPQAPRAAPQAAPATGPVILGPGAAAKVAAGGSGTGIVGSTARVNAQGQAFTVKPAVGGVWHVYPDHRVFVKGGK